MRDAAVPELPKHYERQDAAAARDELFAGGGKKKSTNPWDDDDDDGEMLRVQQQKEMARLQATIFSNTADAIDLGADTLEVLEAQREQTQNDMRRIEMINNKLTDAERLIKKMERGMFNLGSSKEKVQPPQPKVSDRDFPIQVKRGMRYGRHILRFAKTTVARLSERGDEMHDSFNYGQVEFVSVSKSRYYFTMNFNIPVKPWLVYAQRYEDIIREMVKRAGENHFHIPVEFEPGAKEFSYIDESAAAAEAARDPSGAAGNARFLEEVARGGKKVDMDDMYDVLGQGLEQLQEIGRKQQEVIKAHTADLEEMAPEVTGLRQNITTANRRVHKLAK